MTRIAVYPGSFDPITNGHVDIIRRSLRVFDRVIAAVAFNANKDSSWFTPQERVAMIRDTFHDAGDRLVLGFVDGGNGTHGGRRTRLIGGQRRLNDNDHVLAPFG